MRNAILLTALVTPILACVAFGWQRNPENKALGSEAKVFIGQSLDDAKKAMSSRKIEFGAGGRFAFSKGDPDHDYLSLVIDKSHTLACIWYSKSKSQVIGLSLVFRPFLQATKGEYTWLAATELVFHEDRSYSVKFKPPLTDEERRKVEASRPPLQHPPNNQ
jgi:hypothetical protein